MKRPDVIVASSPQFFTLFAGWWLRLWKRAPLVLEIRDLWPDSIEAVGVLKPGRVLSALRVLERSMYRSADSVVTVTEAMRKHVIQCGVPSERVVVFTNGVDLEAFAMRQDAGARFEKYRDRFLVVYAGTFGMAHRLEVVIRAAQRLKGTDIHVLLVGSGADAQHLRDVADAMDLKNLEILDRIPREEMPGLYAVADAGLVMLADHPVFRTVLPSKLFELMAMGIPVVLAGEGECRRLVEAYACGMVVSPEDSEALARAIQVLHNSPDAAKRYGENGCAGARADFSRQQIARAMLAHVRRVKRVARRLR